MKLSENVLANIGTLDGAVWQNNGTERIKGSCSALITQPEQIVEFLNSIVKPTLEEHPDTTSRLSLRFFCTKDVVEILKKQWSTEWEGFRLTVEVWTPIREWYWVWLGGTIPDRITSPALMEKLEEQYHQPFNATENTVFASDTVCIEQLNNPSRAEIVELASLYARRLPVYVAPNNDPDYLEKEVFGNVHSTVFIARERVTNKIVAAIINEFADYPLKSADKTVYIRICESNDWVKEPRVSANDFQLLLRKSLEEAQTHQPDCIETECVPSAFRTAKKAGFRPLQHGLLRQSRIVSDIPNPEHADLGCPGKFRHFTSLFMFIVTTD